MAFLSQREMGRVQKVRYCFRGLIEIFDVTSCRPAELLQVVAELRRKGRGAGRKRASRQMIARA